MSDKKPSAINLSDYQEVAYDVEFLNLEFELNEEFAIIKSHSKLRRKKNYKDHQKITLHGEDLDLLQAKYNQEDLEHQKDSNFLWFTPKDESFELYFETKIYPQKNFSLMGLYKSGDIFCTQNEAEGFRKITYFFDRPDVLTKYKTKIIADKEKYPHILANGNKIESGQLENNKHFATWEDPFKKPCYLFALVAGDFDVLEDKFKTKSGKEVKLQIFVDKGNLQISHHAMNSLKQSMVWDEKTYGLEYDLDIYMIVAVDSFNMGAMENKGLNIFNSKYVLGDIKTATDTDFYNIQAVIGHEYFHNWTGNRITCKDWFQLTLKEGLTVFRDQEFSADLNSRGVKRIDDVKGLRSHQFIEDAGDFSHPIKPKSYIEINNFYTATIYEKGAEIIRMYETILGQENYKKAFSYYIENFDGQAATTENFFDSMENFSPIKLDTFKKWYDVNGTPDLEVKELSKGHYLLEQSFKDHNHDTKMCLPLKLKAIGSKKEIEFLKIKDSEIIELKNDDKLLVLQDKSIEVKIDQRAFLSINRGFSAPIKIHRELNLDQYKEMLSKEDDLFNLWDLGQNLFKDLILKNVKEKESFNVISEFKTTFLSILKNKDLDSHFKSYFFTIASESELNEYLETYDFENVNMAKESLKSQIANLLEAEFFETYQKLSKTSSEWNAKNMGDRAWKNTALSYLSTLRKNEYFQLAKDQFFNASNMTDEVCALNIANSYQLDSLEEINNSFINNWKSDSLVIIKFFQALALSDSNDVIEKIIKVSKSEYFNIKIPNHVYSLFGAFTKNLKRFHDSDSKGYQFLAKTIAEIDKFNPQVASRLAKSFKKLSKLPSNLRENCIKELSILKEENKLSKDTYEIISKTLGTK